MPYTKEEHQQVAQEAARDQFGHFSKKPPLPNSSNPPNQTVNIKVDTPQKPSNSDQLVSLNIKNPLTYLTHYINKLIGKPITIKIPPLFALPVVVALLGIVPASFGLGKVAQKQEIAALPTPTPIVIIQPTATPAPVLVSRMGTIKATYQVESLLNSSPSITVAPTDTQSSSSATPTQIPPTPTPVPTRFVLEKGETITFLIAPTVNLSSYLNRKVLITGLYDKTKNTLQVSKSSDIEILP